MPTIVSSTDDFRKIYEKHSGSFGTNCTPSFHNLLWQFIVNEIHKDKIVALTAVYRKGRLEIGIAEFNKPGYIPTSVAFLVPHDKAVAICRDLNESMFGQTPKLSMMIIATSMRKPEMKELGDKNYTLISHAVKSEGTYNPDVIMPEFEEDLTSDECNEIRKFLAWVDEDVPRRCFGHGNYEERFAEWKNLELASK